jgi:hypothetical protein
LEFGEENKKCLKLNFTGPEFFSLRQTHRGASYKVKEEETNFALVDA